MDPIDELPKTNGDLAINQNMVQNTSQTSFTHLLRGSLVIGENTARRILNETPSFMENDGKKHSFLDDKDKKNESEKKMLGSDLGSNQVLEGGIQDFKDEEDLEN